MYLATLSSHKYYSYSCNFTQVGPTLLASASSSVAGRGLRLLACCRTRHPPPRLRRTPPPPLRLRRTRLGRDAPCASSSTAGAASVSIRDGHGLHLPVLRRRPPPPYLWRDASCTSLSAVDVAIASVRGGHGLGLLIFSEARPPPPCLLWRRPAPPRRLRQQCPTPPRLPRTSPRRSCRGRHGLSPRPIASYFRLIKTSHSNNVFWPMKM